MSGGALTKCPERNLCVLAVLFKVLIHFTLCRTYCGFGCLWIHPLPAYRPAPDSTLPYEGTATWLPACFQRRRGATLTIAPAPPKAAGRNTAAPRSKMGFLWWLNISFLCLDSCLQAQRPRLDVRAAMMIGISLPAIWIMHISTGSGIPAWFEVAVC